MSPRSGLGDGPPLESLDVAAYRVPTSAPEADGTFAWAATTVVVVHARAGGAVGLGWTYAAAAAGDVVAGVLADVVAGADALDVRAAHTAMARALRNVGLPGVGACALSAVDVALWDLAARLLGLPLVRLLGRTRPSVPLYGSGGFTTEDDGVLRDRLEGWVGRDGARAVKIKIGEARGARTGRDLARTALARQAVGPDVALFVDANGAYDVGQAVRVERALRAHGVAWFEEPVSSDDTAGLAHVRGRALADVAAGEYCYRPADARTLLDAGAVDCLQLDVTRCGGFTTWLDLAAAAAARGLDVSAHGAPQLAVHAACAAERVRHVEWFHDHARLEPMLFEGCSSPADGLLTPRLDRAGHGLTLRAADARRFALTC